MEGVEKEVNQQKTDQKFKYFEVGSNHPLIKDKLRQLRDKNTLPRDFRRLVSDVAILLAYEATKNLHTSKVTIETPIQQCTAEMLSEKIGLVPILRAGLGMTEGLLQVLPDAKVIHIGLYRDEKTLQPVKYYCKLDNLKCDVDVCFVLDPMLATGGSAVETIKLLKEWGVKKIGFLCILASVEGIQNLKSAHPDVSIYACGVDEKLNEIGYICPGLGDAGDRQYGTVHL